MTPLFTAMHACGSQENDPLQAAFLDSVGIYSDTASHQK